MKVKDFIYIGLILIAGICGAMLSGKINPAIEISPIEKDIKTKVKILNSLQHKYDSLYKEFVVLQKQSSKDSLTYITISVYNNKIIKNLNNKINEISFKGYSNHKLDSLIIKLYGPEAVRRTE